MDRESVGFLLCVICKRPLEDPRRTRCGHIFCSDCIIRWIATKTNSCPVCRSYVSVGSLSFVSDSLHYLLDNLYVECTLCGQQDIPRENFRDHIEKMCPNVPVSCHYADIKCGWIGKRSQLSNHLTTCGFDSLRPVFNELIVENRQLSELYRQQLYQNEELRKEMICRHNETVEWFSSRLDQHEAQIKTLIDQIASKNIKKHLIR